jgi:succinate dehydrogenase / fumarate reductase flavoprotein subunit
MLFFPGIMEEHAGLFRNKTGLEKGLEKIIELKERFKKAGLTDKADGFNNELLAFLELGNMLSVSHAILLSALTRNESRGAHSRTDFPQRDDANWLKHTLIHEESDELKLSYKNVVVTKIKPAERKY